MRRSRRIASWLLKSWRPVPRADVVPVFARSDGVPRRVHRIWLGGELPSPLRANVEDLAARNPSWSQHVYREAEAADFVAQHYGPEVLRCYRWIDERYPAARSDLLRYLILYRLGGVYLDVKSSARRPLDAVVRADDHYLLAQWPNRPGEPFEGWGLWPELAAVPGGEFVQWFIVCSAGHPFLRAVIRRVLENVARYSRLLDEGGRPGVVRTTGPIPYTLAIAPELARHAHRRVDAERDLGFVYTVVPDWRSNRDFAPHYSALASPVVVPAPVDRVADRLGDALVACRVAVRKTLVGSSRQPP